MKVKIFIIFLIIFFTRILFVSNYGELNVLYAVKESDFNDRQYISAIAVNYFKEKNVSLKEMREDHFYIQSKNSTLNIKEIIYKTKRESDIKNLREKFISEINHNSKLTLMSAYSSIIFDKKSIFYDFIFSLGVVILIIIVNTIVMRRKS